ncbi:VOC family protein [Subtercola endophyticus]|uniref:VOC family protein n=1 Tax=Subtercola endophyticus TaxID=2895559 RepID=UPI001E533A3D|nr:VOC family protein [Subtercola endophyticus]UFS57918.1 VOC family protein [Subtercola endophyticus]
MTITHVQLFSVPVSDQDRARDFYVGTLGFDLVNDVQMGPDMRWLQVSPPGAPTSITLVTWFESMPAGSTKGIVLETDDLVGEVERLTALGVATSPIEQQPWGTFVTFDDPDGNGIVLQETAMR